MIIFIKFWLVVKKTVCLDFGKRQWHSFSRFCVLKSFFFVFSSETFDKMKNTRKLSSELNLQNDSRSAREIFQINTFRIQMLRNFNSSELLWSRVVLFFSGRFKFSTRELKTIFDSSRCFFCSVNYGNLSKLIDTHFNLFACFHPARKCDFSLSLTCLLSMNAALLLVLILF